MICETLEKRVPSTPVGVNSDSFTKKEVLEDTISRFFTDEVSKIGDDFKKKLSLITMNLQGNNVNTNELKLSNHLKKDNGNSVDDSFSDR